MSLPLCVLHPPRPPTHKSVLIAFQITPLLMSEGLSGCRFTLPETHDLVYTQSFLSYVVGMSSGATGSTSLTTLSCLS